MTTAFITHSDCLKHETPSGHPEQVARLEYILRAVEDLIYSELRRQSPKKKISSQCIRNHT